MTRKLNTEQFITRSEEVHRNKYIYTNTVYTNARGKINLICPVHGEFTQKAMDHLVGKGCKQCYIEGRRNTLKNFIDKAHEVHNNLYCYDTVNYTNTNKNVDIKCHTHGVFQQTPSNHLAGHGCVKCSKSQIPDTLEVFIAKARTVHGNKYDYSLVSYKNTNHKVIIICDTHGEFKQAPNRHLQGSDCPNCAKYGFDTSKPAILYYLKINGGQVYKIGITNRTIDERFSNSELQLIEVIKTWYYENGAEAYEAEQKILNDYRDYKYDGPDILKSGNTELFTIDVLDVTI